MALSHSVCGNIRGLAPERGEWVLEEGTPESMTEAGGLESVG